ncbi:MAG TPA: hypothetical protein VN800_03080 [Candidatus Acidoferrales bacterium]|nr:hypothetical protein [Candidatus Acidoferrales bacterium]
MGAAILVDACLAVFVLASRMSSPHLPIPVEVLGSIAIAAAYGTPAIVGAIALRGRPSLFVAAGLLAGALSFTAFSLVTLVLVPPAILFLGAVGGARRFRLAASIGAVVVLPAILAALAVGAFAAVWLLPVGLAGAGIGSLARDVRATRRGLDAARIVAGVVTVVGLAAAAWFLPIVDTTAICWSTQGGSAGCDGGVPATGASALSLLLTGMCALTAASVVPRVSIEPGG